MVWLMQASNKLPGISKEELLQFAHVTLFYLPTTFLSNIRSTLAKVSTNPLVGVFYVDTLCCLKPNFAQSISTSSCRRVFQHQFGYNAHQIDKRVCKLNKDFPFVVLEKGQLHLVLKNIWQLQVSQHNLLNDLGIRGPATSTPQTPNGQEAA